MSEIIVTTANLGSNLSGLMCCEDIVPGAMAGYQVCKDIYVYHVMGAKIAERPVKMAQSQHREITIDAVPLDKVREAFLKEWHHVKADNAIFNTATQARVYGIATLAVMAEDIPPERPIPYKEMPKLNMSFNVFDPLNTAGSMILNQDPNAIDFQHVTTVRVNGKTYHKSRTCVLMHENPIYIEYTSSGFGFVGRSAYQRALYPLKSFISSMVCDDMVMTKAGVIVAKIKQAGSIINQQMQAMFGFKRDVVKEAQNKNVISVGSEDAIESLNLQNIDGAYGMARKNVIENIATGAAMPSKLLLEESFAEGFGEGAEDAKYVASYVGEIRDWMAPLYSFMDTIVQYRAWNQEFYKTIQAEFPEQYGSVGYTQFFYDCVNSFKATWPSLITEPDSEKIKVDDVKLKAAIAAVEVLLPVVDPENKAIIIAWLQDTFNSLKLLFPNAMELDFEALENYVPPEPLAEPGEPSAGKPFAANDSERPGMRNYNDAVRKLMAEADQVVTDAVLRRKAKLRAVQ